MMNLTNILVHLGTATKWLKGLAIAFLLAFGVIVHTNNKKLSESLEMALNNIEAYLGSLQESLLANNVLRLDIANLDEQNDKLLKQLDSVRKELNIKAKRVNTAATQKQAISVNMLKEIKGDIILILKDTIYEDSIKPNDLTTVYYTIGKDTVGIGLDIKNTQYLYIYSDRVYKNKKSFIKRLFTLDFKKVNKYKYNIVNTNDLINTTDVRVVEAYK